MLETFHLPSEHEWSLLQSVWPMCDAVPSDVLDAIADALSLGTLGTTHLTGQNLLFFQGLPVDVTVFRGASPDRRHGYSWTTDENTAEGFARGHRGILVRSGTIYRGTIAKDAIWTVFADREESEIFIHPKNVRRVRVHRRVTDKKGRPLV